tara:strand:+ start:243 stop:419 length:177 start_codon:yes stop_codon:yes gene_type:complete
MKVGDVISVDYVSSHGNHWKWVGILTGIYGHKLEFLIDGKFDVWRMSDLKLMKAEVLN